MLRTDGALLVAVVRPVAFQNRCNAVKSMDAAARANSAKARTVTSDDFQVPERITQWGYDKIKRLQPLRRSCSKTTKMRLRIGKNPAGGKSGGIHKERHPGTQ